jgi:1-acyl-sn-glycerol-3-phosphate acyltransferase
MGAVMRRGLLAVLALILFAANTFFWAVSLYLVTFAKLLIPFRGFRAYCTRLLVWIAEAWIDGNTLIIGLTQRTIWDVELPALELHASYLVVSNHCSSVDIPALQKVLNHRIPLLKFFLKRKLIYVPVLGLAWWALDFPFMRRYPRHLREQRPELRSKDLESVLRACERFRGQDVSILNFLEGTRFTPEKQKRLDSPYRHLLPPRAGGIAGVVSSMGDRLQGILDLTIVYSAPRVGLWDLFCGRVARVTVRGRLLSVPAEAVGMDYGNDPEFRKRFQDWVNQLWAEKDEQIETLSRRWA